jgi:hypothetical protein
VYIILGENNFWYRFIAGFQYELKKTSVYLASTLAYTYKPDVVFEKEGNQSNYCFKQTFNILFNTSIVLSAFFLLALTVLIVNTLLSLRAKKKPTEWKFDKLTKT